MRILAWAFVSFAALACVPGKSDSRAKSDPAAEPAVAPAVSAPGDLDPYGESCKREWGEQTSVAPDLALAEDFKFQYDFCSELKKLTWPGGSGSVDLKGLLKLNVPMAFDFWQKVFASREIEIKDIDLRLQIVLDGKFNEIKFGPAVTMDTQLSLKGRFSENSNLCNTTMEEFSISAIAVRMPQGERKIPDNIVGFFNQQALQSGGWVHGIIEKNLKGWFFDWMNGTLSGLRKAGCDEALLIQNKVTPKP